jgi:PAS domain S-box-containing protein
MNARNDDLLARIFDFIGDPIFVKDRNHKLRLVNEAMCKELGRAREQLFGLDDDDLFGAKEAAFFRSRDERVFLTGEEDVSEETFTPVGSDASKTVITRKRLYVDPAGNPFIVGVFKDITAIKAAEAALQKANETLEEKVRARTAELEKANAELKGRLEDLRRAQLALEEKARIESELEAAKKIQTHYVPETPAIPGMELHGVCLPAREIGGDYLDYFQNENGDWVIAIADVCGKGIPAAMVMTSLRSCIRSEGRRQTSSRELLVSVNRLMCRELEREMSFITCLCIIVSKDGHELNFSRAGHPNLVAFGGGVPQPGSIASKGIALGMSTPDDFDARLEEVRLPLRPGDRFFAFTDGVDEAMDANLKPYGKARLFRVLERDRERPADAVVKDVLDDVRRHASDKAQHDDMTLLTLERIA